jgi:hypothetical protein
MTEGIFPLARRQRRRGREQLSDPDAEVVSFLADWAPLHAIASELPHWEPGDVGRPPHMPPALALIFGIMRWAWGSERAVERQLRHRATWEPVRARLHQHYPDYIGVASGAAAPSRSQYRRFVQTYGIDDEVFQRLLDAFREQAAAEAQRLGALNPATRNQLTHPEPTNFVSGDVTLLRSRFRAARGARYVDPNTAEIYERLYDPDAETYTGTDGEGNQNQRVLGTRWLLTHVWLPHTQERVLLDIVHIDQSLRNEGDAAVDSVTAIAARTGGVTGLVYDMAVRGRHRELLYQRGMLTITRVPSRSGGKGRRLGRYPATQRDGTRTDVELWTIDGTPHIREVAAGEPQFVALKRVQTRRRPGKRGSVRWYNQYVIPDHPLVREQLRGAVVLVRLDDPDFETRRPGGVSRADNLHAIAPGDHDWYRVFALRPPAESMNNWVKQRLPNKRAPAVGKKRQYFALLCAGLYNNARAVLAHTERLSKAA